MTIQDTEHPAAILQLRRIIDKVTYKPGWDMRAEHGPHYKSESCGYLWLTLTTKNTYPPYQMMPIAMTFPVYDITLSDRRMTDWLRDCIRWLEAHEIDECLIVDGERPYNPHRDGYKMPNPPEIRMYPNSTYRYGLYGD